MKARILTLVILIVSVMVLTGQSIVGDWEGTLDVQGSKLKVVFHISEEGGKYTSTMDSPNQGAFDIEMDETTFDNETLTITNSQMSMKTVAIFNSEEDKIEGTFNQGPMKLPIELARVEEVAAVQPTNNHPMAGDWNTAVNVMGNQLRLIFHITENDGKLSTTLDSPDQGAFGLEMDETEVEGNNIRLSAKSMGINITGEYVPDSNIINANFKQGPLNEDIVLKREAIAKQVINRPQEPKTFDYKMEEVTFTNPNGGHELAGTLTIPKNGKFEKVVILVSGSGPQDRNEELLGHKPFLVLSDHLTKNGIAVLRYDDRGVGESTGDFGTGTSMDFALDATSAVEYLRSREDMEGKLIGIMGHSEGGLIAPIVADKTKIDFMVLLAGPGIASDDLLLEQSEAISRANGIDEDQIAFNIESSRMVFDYMNSHQDEEVEQLKEGMRVLLKKRFAALSEEDLEEIGDVDAEIESQINTITSPWFRYFIAYEADEYLEKVTVPVLAVNGSLDLQVLADSNLKGIEQGLKKANNQNFTIKKFDGLNHLFQVSADGSGSPSEYGALEETFNEKVMAYITDWLHNFN